MARSNLNEASVLQARQLRLKAKLFRGFGDASRLAIVEALRGGPRTVSELVELTGLAQSNTSNHLSCLLDCGLVAREQKGRFAEYRLAGEEVEELLALADRILSDVAKGAEGCRRYEDDEAGR